MSIYCRYSFIVAGRNYIVTKTHSRYHAAIEQESVFHCTVCSLINRKVGVTGTSFSAFLIKKVSCFYCFYGAILDSYRENLVALGGESCSSCWKPGSDSCLSVYQWTHCIIKHKEQSASLEVLDLNEVFIFLSYNNFSTMTSFWENWYTSVSASFKFGVILTIWTKIKFIQ
jgi:hypothetical protein